jgi:hypothetical protein
MLRFESGDNFGGMHFPIKYFTHLLETSYQEKAILSLAALAISQPKKYAPA